MLTTIKERFLFFQKDKEIKIESLDIIKNKKISIVFSYKNLFGSMEILINETCDLIIVEYESEDILFEKTIDKCSESEFEYYLNELIIKMKTLERT